MTSLAMIIGLLPLMFTTGAGAAGNFSLGVAAVGGMLVGVLLQVIFVPGLYYIAQNWQERIHPIQFETKDDSKDEE